MKPTAGATMAFMNTLAVDLRRHSRRAAYRPVGAVEESRSAREAAARFEVNASAALKMVRRIREMGSTEPAKIEGYRKPLLAITRRRCGS